MRGKLSRVTEIRAYVSRNHRRKVDANLVLLSNLKRNISGLNSFVVLNALIGRDFLHFLNNRRLTIMSI